MEHVVEAGSGRQFQLIGDIVDDGGDAVRPVEARLELSCRRHVKRRGGPLAQSEPDRIAHLVSDIPVMPVVVMLVHGLGLLKAEADVSEELVSFRHVLGDRRDPCLAGLIGADGGWVTAVDHPERCVAERGLVGGVVDVLRLGEQV
jgi:hypothetical protein